MGLYRGGCLESVHRIQLLGPLSTWPVEGFYRFIALEPNAPSTAEATAMIAFRMISHTDFFIGMVVHLLSDAFK